MYISIEVAAAALEVLVFSIYLKGLYRKYARSTFFILASYAAAGAVLCFFGIFSVSQMIHLSLLSCRFFPVVTAVRRQLDQCFYSACFSA